MGKNSKGGTDNMKKILILVSIIMLLFSVAGTAEEVKQEDIKAVESLIDIMSGKIADYGEQIGDAEDVLKTINKDVEALETKIQGLNATDRFLWTKIEAQSPEAMIESRVNALKEQMEEHVAQLESEIAKLAEKAEDQTALKILENRIKALTENMKNFIGEEKEQQKLVVSIEEQTTRELESLSRTLAELETYSQNLKAEFQNALDSLSKKLVEQSTAAETLAKEELEILRKALEDAKSSLNTRAKWMDISIKSVKDDLSSLAAEMTKENAMMKDQLEQYKASTNQRLKWIDMTIAKNKGRIESVMSNVTTVQEKFDSQLEESIWSLNQRLKWVDINTGNLRASLDKAIKNIDDNRVYISNQIDELENTIQNNQASTNQRMKWTDISISNIKNNVQDNKEMIQELLKNIETDKNNEVEVVENSDFDETIANLNQRLKWMKQN